MIQTEQDIKMQTLFNRLNSYVKKRDIKIHEFWKSNRVCINIQEFLLYADQINFKVYQQDFDILQQQFPEQLINVKGLCQLIQYWGQSRMSITDFLQQKSKILNQQDPKIKINKTRTLHSTYTLKTQSQIQSMRESALYKNKKRLIEYKNKERRNELLLQKTIIKNQNEGEFELVLKVAEVNQICSKLKNELFYVLKKQQGKNPIITEHNKKTSTQTVLNQKIFMKKYIFLKEESINKYKIDKQTSESELKKTLIETMYISEQLKAQIQLIRSRGITSNTCK